MLFTLMMNRKFQTIIGKDTTDFPIQAMVLEVEQEITGALCAFGDIDFGPCEVGEVLIDFLLKDGVWR